MKPIVILSPIVAMIAGLLAIPLLIAGPSAIASGCAVANIEVVLDTIRTIESSGRYDIPPNRGGASGAYQYIDSTWNDFAGYQSAYLAPPTAQDQRAMLDVERILERYGTVEAVPVAWYWPRALTDPADMDIVPMPNAGNRLTVREYQQRWLDVYRTKLAETTEDSGSLQARLDPCAIGEVSIDGYALPIPRSIVDANPGILTQPHHDYPAVDIIIPEGIPIYAVHAGVVARVVNWNHNCYDVTECVETCGIGLSIDGDDGARWIYCHGSQLHVTLGQRVAAGQPIMLSGNTGRSGTPHLHLELRINDERICPQPLLEAIWKALHLRRATAVHTAYCS